MTLYSVYEAQDPAAATGAPAMVADRFSWLAMLLPPVYLAVHGLWLALAGFAVAMVAVLAAGLWLGGEAAFWLFVLLVVFLGFEAPSLRRARLTRLGYRYRAEMISVAEDLAAVEWLKGRAIQ